VKKGSATGKVSKVDGDSKLLSRFQHHHAMADKHRAHADLIEAKLKTQGKRIDRYGDSYPQPPKTHKPKIVPNG
jgi:hypothetical protein